MYINLEWCSSYNVVSRFTDFTFQFAIVQPSFNTWGIVEKFMDILPKSFIYNIRKHVISSLITTDIYL